jgi:cytochrome c5
MSTRADRYFINRFALVVILLHAVAIGILVLARIVSAHTQEQYVRAEEGVRRAIEGRIAPFAREAIAGADNSKLAIAVDAGPGAAGAGGASKPLLEMDGQKTFETVCTACHGAGIAGAPRFGDAAEWGPRIAKGKEVLHEHALKGFQGAKGLMPPKGGRADLSDQSVIKAVDYMVSHAGG